MKTISVIALDATHLQLEEDAFKGDVIDLANIVKIDMTYLSSLLEKEKNSLFEKRLQEERESLKKLEESNLEKKHLEWEKQQKEFEEEKQKEITELTIKLSSLKKDYEFSLLKKEAELKEQYQKTIDSLTIQKKNLEDQREKESQALNENFNLKLESEKKNFQLSHNEELSALRTQLQQVKKDSQMEKELELSRQKEDMNKTIISLKEEIASLQLSSSKQKEEEKKIFDEALRKEREKSDEYKSKYDELYRNRSSLNVKTIGENLETWCDSSMKSVMSLGAFSHCTWEKDTNLVKSENDDSKKGTKADYLFRAYSSSTPDKIEVTSCCMDMKSENPDSVNKKKNADYFKKLDEDRRKKNCEYALLVSELEWKSDNDVPIFKVEEYPFMYVVRPPYFVTFLGILYNLGMKYASLMTQRSKEDERFKSSKEIEEEFEKFKQTYLDTPLESLNKKVKDIQDCATKILANANKIHDECDSIIQNSLEGMKAKIETLSLKMTKLERKIEKLNN